MALCSTCIATSYEFVDNCEINQPGGNYKQISVLPYCYLDTITVDADGVITAITLDTVGNPAATWYTVNCKKDTVSTTETAQFPSNALLQEIAFTISNYADDVDLETAAQLQANFLNDILNTKEGFIVVVRDKVGVRRFYGATNPLFVSALVKSSGLVSTDLAGTAITFSESQPKPAPAIDAAVTSTGLVPGL